MATGVTSSRQIIAGKSRSDILTDAQRIAYLEKFTICSQEYTQPVIRITVQSVVNDEKLANIVASHGEVLLVQSAVEHFYYIVTANGLQCSCFEHRNRKLYKNDAYVCEHIKAATAYLAEQVQVQEPIAVEIIALTLGEQCLEEKYKTCLDRHNPTLFAMLKRNDAERGVAGIITQYDIDVRTARKIAEVRVCIAKGIYTNKSEKKLVAAYRRSQREQGALQGAISTGIETLRQDAASLTTDAKEVA